jgi:hypothetical protein
MLGKAVHFESGNSEKSLITIGSVSTYVYKTLFGRELKNVCHLEMFGR